MSYYEKTLLYAYSNLEELANQIDEIVLRKAITSYYNFSPCEKQAENIMEISWQKKLIIDLKIRLDRIFSTFAEDDLDYFDYKYFKIKDKKHFENFDPFSRNYFRKQIKLMDNFSKKLLKEKMTFEWFQKTYGKIDFFNQLMSRVKEKEDNLIINNTQKRKVKKAVKVIKAVVTTEKLNNNVIRVYNNRNISYS